MCKVCWFHHLLSATSAGFPKHVGLALYLHLSSTSANTLLIRTWEDVLVFMGFCVICEVVVYFFISETRGRTVEEMRVLFGEEDVLHMTSDGRGLVEKSDGVALTHVEVVEDEA